MKLVLFSSPCGSNSDTVVFSSKVTYLSVNDRECLLSPRGSPPRQLSASQTHFQASRLHHCPYGYMSLSFQVSPTETKLRSNGTHYELEVRHFKLKFLLNLDLTAPSRYIIRAARITISSTLVLPCWDLRYASSVIDGSSGPD